MMLRNPDTDWMFPVERSDPGPTVAEAYKMGGLASLAPSWGSILEHTYPTPPEQVFASVDKAQAQADKAQAALESSPHGRGYLAARETFPGAQMRGPLATASEVARDLVAPQGLSDALMMMGTGPVGRAAAIMGATFDPDTAQAGKSKLPIGALGRAAEKAEAGVKNWTMGETVAPVPLDVRPSVPLFDYSRIGEVPDVRQFDLERYAPARGVPERITDLMKNKKVERQMLERIEAGKDIGIGAEKFYNTEPLRDAFIAELGKEKGPGAFARYMDYASATSPRSKVPENVRNASYYYGLDQQGLPMPAVGDKNPQPYGHMAQRLHQQGAQRVAEGGWDMFVNPKPPSYSQNLQGNLAPVTVDAHAYKLPAMLSGDPRFLAQSYKASKETPIVYPRRMHESGELSMSDAMKEPTMWVSAPEKNEYAAMEQYYKRLAREVGLAPGQAQASAWAAGGPMTGLGSVAGEPFLRTFENRLDITAKKRGISKAEALSRMIRGKEPLLAVPPAAAMGALAAQDQYEQ